MNLIVEKFPKVSVLFGSSFYQKGIRNYKVKGLKGLSKRDATKLFIEKIPYQEESVDIYSQIRDLHDFSLDIFESMELKFSSG